MNSIEKEIEKNSIWHGLSTNTIHHWDCLELMKLIPDKSIDLVLTDPPYGINLDKWFSGSGWFCGKPIERRKYNDERDKFTPSQEYFDEIFRISKNVIIFWWNFFTDKIPQSNHWIFWDKNNTMPTFWDWELIYTNIERNSVKKYYHEYNWLIWAEPTRYHPTQKPLVLIKKLLENYSEPWMTILDPFLWSWTTAVACKELWRNFIGIEKELKYVDIANKRLATTTVSLFS